MVFHTAHQFRTRSSFRLLCQNTWQTDDLSLVSALLGWRNVPFHSRWHRLQPQTNITLFFALGERGATVHHRMVKLATKWETSGDNRWLPRLFQEDFHAAPLYRWPKNLVAKTHTSPCDSLNMSVISAERGLFWTDNMSMLEVSCLIFCFDDKTPKQHDKSGLLCH